MIPYELLEHTADAKFRAFGKTKEEAFANAVKGLAAIVTDPAGIAHTKSQSLAVHAKDLKGLLFDFLDQLIYLVDTEGFLAAEAEVRIEQTHEGFALAATLNGDDVRKYGANLKAATYSDMVCEEREGIWTIQAVIDI